MSEFVETGLITAPDMAALACYAQSYARWIQAEEQVSREGQVVSEPITTRSGNLTGKHRRKRHPAVSVAKDERALMISAGRLFGFDPVSRQRVAAPLPSQPQSGDDTDADIFVN